MVDWGFENTCCGDRPLKDTFPALYWIAGEQVVLVAVLQDSSSGIMQGNVSFQRAI